MLAEIILKVAGMEKKSKSKYYPRPSIAGPERCLRQTVYWASGIPADKQMADRFVLVLDDSSWHEELTADWMRKTAYNLHSEQMEVEVEGLKGHIDGIITDITGTDYLWEHKAINHFTFERYWKGTWPLDYITQCCMYLRGLKKINPDMDIAVLLIKNKNTSQYIDMVIRYDAGSDTACIQSVTHSNGDKRQSKDKPLLEIKNIISDALGKFVRVSEYACSKTLPDRPFEIGTTFPCDYCSWGKTCWEGYEKEYLSLSTDVELTGEITNFCKYYLELNGHLKNMNKEKDDLKAQIKAILKEKEVSKGKAGEYTIHNRLQGRETIDKDLIPGDILSAAMKKTYSEILTIRKPKIKEAR